MTHKSASFTPNTELFLSGKGSSSFLRERPGCRAEPGGMPASPEEVYSSLWDMANHSSWAQAQIPPPSSFPHGRVPWQPLKWGQAAGRCPLPRQRTLTLFWWGLWAQQGIIPNPWGSTPRFLVSRESSPQGILHWAGSQSVLMVEVKDQSLVFQKAAFCMFLCSYSFSCWPRAQPAWRICICVEQVWALTLLRERKGWCSPFPPSLWPKVMLSKQTPCSVWDPGLKCLHTVFLPPTFLLAAVIGAGSCAVALLGG